MGGPQQPGEAPGGHALAPVHRADPDARAAVQAAGDGARHGEAAARDDDRPAGVADACPGAAVPDADGDAEEDAGPLWRPVRHEVNVVQLAAEFAGLSSWPGDSS